MESGGNLTTYMLFHFMKRILMTADTIGGVWTYAFELAKCLDKYGIEVHLACMGKLLSADQLLLVKDIKNLSIHSSNYKLEWMKDPWEDIEKAGNWLLELERYIQPDIIHLNNYVHGNLNWHAPVVMVAHSCVFTWWKSVKGENPPEDWKLYFKKVKEGLRTADLVIGVSQHYLNEIIKIYGPLKLSRVIHNGLNPDDYFIREKKSMIIGMGRVWDEGKNLKMLSSISKKVNWSVFIAGSLNLADNKAQNSNEKNDIFLGQLSQCQIKYCLSEASIYVLPAKYEPFGLSALEAALSGCVLVLADIPTLKEIWGDAAVYFDVHNVKELESVINKLIEDENLLKNYQKKAFEKAGKYHINEMTASYIEAYQQMIMYKMQKKETCQ
jgi:glycosyltransferase involved in cell wall biosynthesis